LFFESHVLCYFGTQFLDVLLRLNVLSVIQETLLVIELFELVPHVLLDLAVLLVNVLRLEEDILDVLKLFERSLVAHAIHSFSLLEQ
jgi:hypothetical protein